MRRRLWPWVLGSLGGSLLLVAGTFVAVLARARSVLDGVRVQALADIEAYRRRPLSRKPWGGPAIEGNAWDLYRIHLPRLRLLRGEEDLLSGTPDDAAVGRLLDSRAEDVAALRRGLRCTRLDPGLPYGNALEGSPAFDVDIPLNSILVEGAYFLRRKGREADAVDLLLLGFGLARDLAMGTGGIGRLECATWEEQNLRAIGRLLDGHSLEPKALHDLGVALDLLDPDPADDLASWDLGLRLPDERLFRAPALSCSPPGPRHLWSWAVARASSQRIHERFAEELRARFTTPSPDTPARLDRLVEEQDRLRDVHPAYVREDALLLKLALIGRLYRRLSRLAVAVAEYEAAEGRFPDRLEDLVPRQIPTLPIDPYTAQPFRSAGGKVWSVGADGLDHGGQSNPRNELDPEKPGTDVVVAVRRKR